MRFGPVKIGEAEGAILAHSLKAGKATFRKGRRLSPADLAALAEAGVTEVIAAVLEADDVHEDEAAAKLAQAICGSGLETTPAFTGRSNLKASAPGLLVLDGARLDALNEIDEAITIATVPAFAPLEAGQMVATVKIIPFAVPQAALESALAVAGEGEPLLRLAPFRARRAGLVQTHLPGMKESLLEKARSALDARLARLGSPPAEERRVAHRAEAVSAALKELDAEGCDLLLVSGASAVVDRRDVVPAGIVAAGGAIDHFGMPVDPGNLLLLGHIGATPAIGLPGCARSPKENGFDWVLARLLADLPVTRREVMRMGGGGLLTEIGSRPLPRAEAVKRAEAPLRQVAPKIAALLLAAGQSRRMGAVNKLLAVVGGEPMVVRAGRALLASQARPVVAVTGHEAERVAHALARLEMATVHNPDYAAGLATSLKAGLAALREEIDGVIVCLADMPTVGAEVLDRLITAFNPLQGRAICVPTWQGKRGNPVLFARRFFPELMSVSGDLGGRGVIGQNQELVAEVPMPDAAVLVDIDTPAALAAANAESERRA